MIKISCDECLLKDIEMYLFSYSSEDKPVFNNIEISTQDGNTYYFEVKKVYDKYYICTC